MIAVNERLGIAEQQVERPILDVPANDLAEVAGGASPINGMLAHEVE